MPGLKPARKRRDDPGAGQLIREGRQTDGTETRSHRQEAIMFPRWCRLAGLTLLTAAANFSLHSQSFASINQAGALLIPTAAAGKSCSGAFRYAARDGNSDIVAISAVQLFAEDRRLSKTRYTSRAMAGLGTERSPVLSSNTMC
jgi:hypothetical protein